MCSRSISRNPSAPTYLSSQRGLGVGERGNGGGGGEWGVEGQNSFFPFFSPGGKEDKWGKMVLSRCIEMPPLSVTCSPKCCHVKVHSYLRQDSRCLLLIIGWCDQNGYNSQTPAAAYLAPLVWIQTDRFPAALSVPVSRSILYVSRVRCGQTRPRRRRVFSLESVFICWIFVLFCFLVSLHNCILCL